jgi:hypothetical protein
MTPMACDEFPQRFFIGIGNHQALRRTFRPSGLDRCVFGVLRINQSGHDVTLSRSVPTKDTGYTMDLQAGCQTDFVCRGRAAFVRRSYFQVYENKG